MVLPQSLSLELAYFAVSAVVVVAGQPLALPGGRLGFPPGLFF